MVKHFRGRVGFGKGYFGQTYYMSRRGIGEWLCVGCSLWLKVK